MLRVAGIAANLPMNAPNRPSCRLSYSFRGQRGEVVVDRDRLVLGRSSQCDVVFADSGMSRRHAEIAADGDGYVVRDLGSMNGVLYEGERVQERRLEDGARLTIGSVDLRCRIDAQTRPAEVVFDESIPADALQSMVDMDELERRIGRRGATAPPGAPRPAAAPAAAPASPPPVERTLAELAAGAWIAEPLREAAEALLSARDLDEVLRRFLDLVARHLDAERGFVGIRDEASGEIVPRASLVRGGAADRRIVISRQIARVAVESRRALLVGDAATDSRFSEVESIRQMQIRSAMCAPLVRDGRVGGLLYVDKQSAENPFTNESLQVLSILSTLAAVAVEETQLRVAVEQEQRMRARLARYSSRAVVEEIVKLHDGAGEPGMRCDEREVTVLFCDFAGFTSFAEKLAPAEVNRTLNLAFERLCEAVFAEEGTLDKFTGDGMMVFFGAPTRQADHAERAVRAALRMRESLARPGGDGEPPLPLPMRIGINSGPAIVGDLGTPERRDYTVIGDTVNVASRLEHAVAAPGQIVIGPATHELVRARFRCSPLEPRPLKGITRTVQPYLVVADGSDGSPASADAAAPRSDS